MAHLDIEHLNKRFGPFVALDDICLSAERGGFALMPEMGTNPVNRYLPPRKKDALDASPLAPLLDIKATGFAGWLDRVLGKI